MKTKTLNIRIAELIEEAKRAGLDEVYIAMTIQNHAARIFNKNSKVVVLAKNQATEMVH